MCCHAGAPAPAYPRREHRAWVPGGPQEGGQGGGPVSSSVRGEGHTAAPGCWPQSGCECSRYWPWPPFSFNLHCRWGNGGPAEGRSSVTDARPHHQLREAESLVQGHTASGQAGLQLVNLALESPRGPPQLPEPHRTRAAPLPSPSSSVPGTCTSQNARGPYTPQGLAPPLHLALPLPCSPLLPSSPSLSPLPPSLLSPAL